MPRFTIKIKDRYFHWSTIVDAPITDGMLVDEFRKWYIFEYGNSGYNPELFDKMIIMLERFPAVNGNGRAIAETLEEAIAGNCAGKDGEYLTADEIYEQYVDEQLKENKDGK
jgi:hypothetical protein